MRQFFNAGQEILSDDLNSISSRVEKGIFDKILYEIVGRKTNGFFKDSLKATYQNSSQVLVTNGVGFFKETSGPSNEALNKPLILESDFLVTIQTPDSVNPRRDVITVKPSLDDAESDSRKYKDEFTSDIIDKTFVIAKKWGAGVTYRAGVAASYPVLPSIPEGEMIIAEIYVMPVSGIDGPSNIVDRRTILPYATSSRETGSHEWDFITGDTSQAGVTHSTLGAAVLAAPSGSKILVTRNEILNNPIVVSRENIEIVFKKGVSLTNGFADSGIVITGNYCKIVNAHFTDFYLSVHSPLLVDYGATQTIIESPTFQNCANKTQDYGTQTFINTEFER